MANIEKFDDILIDMRENKVDHLIYSWWHNGTKDKFKCIVSHATNHLNIYDMNMKNIHVIEKKFSRYFYVLSAVSISSVKLFNKIIRTNHPKLKRWSKETPFDFEKRSTDTGFYPITLAIPKYELFASIDDDHGNDGYSLISRGLYKNSMSRYEIKLIEFREKRKKLSIFRKIIPNFIIVKIIFIYSILRRIKFTWID
ncbi:hypothetical protein [Candidatus Ruthturnera calyptogenae]|nr:hypothetical protein [Candidatus Ruthturnera calyptogenae]